MEIVPARWGKDEMVFDLEQQDEIAVLCLVAESFEFEHRVECPYVRYWRLVVD